MGLGYLYLALQVTGSVTFGHVIKWSSRQRCNLVAVATINYLFATVLSYLLSIHGRPLGLSAETLLPGIVGGVSYAVSFFFYYQGIRLLGVSISTTAMRLAVMPAVLASMFYWQEQLSLLQECGIVLALLALPLLTAHQGDKTVKIAGPRWVWLLALFAAGSGGPLMLKAFQVTSSSEEKPMLLMVWFGAAAICSLMVLGWQRTLPKSRDVMPGLALGALNVLINLFLLGALELLPGAIVFPVSSAGGVLLATVSSAGLWKERLGRVALGGVAVSILALALINSK